MDPIQPLTPLQSSQSVQPIQPIQQKPHHWWWYVLNISLPLAILIDSAAVFLMIFGAFLLSLGLSDSPDPISVILNDPRQLRGTLIFLLSPILLIAGAAFWFLFAKKRGDISHAPRWLTLVTFVLVVSLFCGFYFSGPIWGAISPRINGIKNIFNHQATSPSPTATSTIQPIPATSLVYRNDEWGFELTFPDAWKGYLVSSYASGQALAGWSFGLPYTFNGKTEAFNLLGISVYSPGAWDILSKEEGPIPTELARTSKGVFAYSIANDMPPEWVGTINPQEVISSFKTF